MSVAAARMRAMNVEKDYSIALEGLRAEREGISELNRMAREDARQMDALDKEMNEQFAQFGQLDMDPYDVERVSQVEKAARKKVADKLREYGGDIVKFMRHGGRGVLNQYASEVRNSREYQDGVVTGQFFRLVDNDLQRGMVPHDIPSPTDPDLMVPIDQAIRMRKAGEWDGPLTYSGAFKPVQLGDLIPLVQRYDSGRVEPVEVPPEYVYSAILSQTGSKRHAEEVRNFYEQNLYGQGKQHGLYFPPSATALRAQMAREANASRVAAASLRQQGQQIDEVTLFGGISQHANLQQRDFKFDGVPEGSQVFVGNLNKQATEMMQNYTGVTKGGKPSFFFVEGTDEDGTSMFIPVALSGSGEGFVPQDEAMNNLMKRGMENGSQWTRNPNRTANIEVKSYGANVIELMSGINGGFSKRMKNSNGEVVDVPTAKFVSVNMKLGSGVKPNMKIGGKTYSVKHNTDDGIITGYVYVDGKAFNEMSRGFVAGQQMRQNFFQPGAGGFNAGSGVWGGGFLGDED